MWRIIFSIKIIRQRIKSNMKIVMNRAIFIIGIIGLWELVYRLSLFSPLIFPSVITIFEALVVGVMEQHLLMRTYNSILIIFQGLGVGILIALSLMALALMHKFLYQLVENLIVFLNPIPGMAIFPLAMIWFGAGRNSIVFAIVHSVVWGLLLNIMSGIHSIPSVYKEIGLNMGLGRLQMVKNIYIPACMPEIISGVKIGLARAWRTAIAAEMAFGLIGVHAGLGWHMSFMRNTLDIPGLFAGVIVIALAGIILEDLVFSTLERRTVVKWGMKNELSRNKKLDKSFY